MMDRRTFMGTVARGLVAAPFAVDAQQVVKTNPPPTLATARNARTAKSYTNVQTAVEEALDGDVIEVSPGVLLYGKNCGSGQPFGGGTACHLAVRTSITIKAMDPTKRPVIRPEAVRIYTGPGGVGTGGTVADGIIIGAPFDLGGKKLDVTIDGIDVQDVGIVYALAAGMLIRSNHSRGWPGSVTFRNIKAKLCTGGIKGSCDSLLLENIECSDGGDGSGGEHNFYIGGGLVTARNVHSYRTRVNVDGHLFKCRSKKTIIEDCKFDNKNGDASALVQVANGGELIMRRSTLTQGAKTANGKGMIWYGDEGNLGSVIDPRTPGYNVAAWQAWLAAWGVWTHSYDIQGCTFVDFLGRSVLVYFSAASPPRVASIFTGNTYPATSVPPVGTTSPVELPPPHAVWPAWRKALALNTLTDISPPGNTAASAYKAAGYFLPGWEGDAGTNLSAWGAGILAPALGKWGGMLCGMNGHALQPASTIHHFDLETARWVAPICPPQIHRRVAPDFLPPPPDAECWYSTKGDLPQLTWDQVLATPQTKPFSVGVYSFPYWPTKYGCRYNTNVSAGMRYDSFAVIPESCGGEPAGTLAIIAPGPCHELNISGSGQLFSWSFGLSTKTHLPHSINQMPAGAARGISATSAFSEKHKKVFTASSADANMGVYDPAKNAHSYIVANADSTAYSIESCAIVTEGHDAHLYISVGKARGTNEFCLYVVDLDKNVAAGGKAWAVQNKTSANGVSAQRTKVLAGVNFQQSGSLAWSKRNQKLIFFQPGPIGGRVGTPPAWTIHIITIPAGSTAGVPNWQTQDWTVTAPQLALAPGTNGMRGGVVSLGYKRFAFSDPLDCAIWAGAPESAPVQAIRLWETKK